MGPMGKEKASKYIYIDQSELPRHLEMGNGEISDGMLDDCFELWKKIGCGDHF